MIRQRMERTKAMDEIFEDRELPEVYTSSQGLNNVKRPIQRIKSGTHLNGNEHPLAHSTLNSSIHESRPASATGFGTRETNECKYIKASKHTRAKLRPANDLELEIDRKAVLLSSLDVDFESRMSLAESPSLSNVGKGKLSMWSSRDAVYIIQNIQKSRMIRRNMSSSRVEPRLSLDRKGSSSSQDSIRSEIPQEKTIHETIAKGSGQAGKEKNERMRRIEVALNCAPSLCRCDAYTGAEHYHCPVCSFHCARSRSELLGHLGSDSCAATEVVASLVLPGSTSADADGEGDLPGATNAHDEKGSLNDFGLWSDCLFPTARWESYLGGADAVGGGTTRRVRKLCTGASFMAALTSNGELYTWGSGGNLPALGHGKDVQAADSALKVSEEGRSQGATRGRPWPTPVWVFHHKVVRSICCGESHMLALAADSPTDDNPRLYRYVCLYYVGIVVYKLKCIVN